MLREALRSSEQDGDVEEETQDVDGQYWRRLSRARAEAEASYKKAITLKPDFIQAIKNRWLLLFSQKRFEEALLDADLCISKGSRQLDLTTLYALGRIDEIYKRLEVRSKVDGENITIAAFASFIAEVEKKNTAYNFCPNPIDFIHHSNLSTHINDSCLLYTSDAADE